MLVFVFTVPEVQAVLFNRQSEVQLKLPAVKPKDVQFIPRKASRSHSSVPSTIPLPHAMVGAVFVFVDDVPIQEFVLNRQFEVQLKLPPPKPKVVHVLPFNTVPSHSSVPSMILLPQTGVVDPPDVPLVPVHWLVFHWQFSQLKVPSPYPK